MTLHPPMLLPTKTYPFEQLRNMFTRLKLRQGVCESGDYLIKQRAAGANMSVDCALGYAWVRGDSEPEVQGTYLEYNDATVNIGPFTAANASFPRLDQVILVVQDSSVAGSSDEPKFVIVTGTATSGATLVNRSGAVSEATIRATYPNFIFLADVLIPSKATTIETVDIKDRRPLGGIIPAPESVSDESVEAGRILLNTTMDMESIGGTSGIPSATRPSIVLITCAAKPQDVGDIVSVLVQVKKNDSIVEEIGAEASRTTSVTGYSSATYPLYLAPGDEWGYVEFTQRSAKGGSVTRVRQIIL